MWQAMKHTHEAVGPRLSGEACNEKSTRKGTYQVSACGLPDSNAKGGCEAEDEARL